MQNNADKLDHLIALAATKCLEEDVKALKDTDVSAVEFDASYYRKRRRNINKYKRRAALRPFGRVASRVAVALLIMLALTGVLIGCVPGWRQAIYEAIVEWYDDHFSVRYEDSEGKVKETSYEEETTATTEAEIKAVPTQIEQIRKPTNLPDGVWEDVVMQNFATIITDYYFNEDYLFSFSQRILKPNDNYVDSEDATVTYTDINGNEATVVEYPDKKETYILWSDGEYSYYISSTECDIQTLIGYAESVK